jgi:hypothetical protein
LQKNSKFPENHHQFREILQVSSENVSYFLLWGDHTDCAEHAPPGGEKNGDKQNGAGDPLQKRTELFSPAKITGKPKSSGDPEPDDCEPDDFHG